MLTTRWTELHTPKKICSSSLYTCMAYLHVSHKKRGSDHRTDSSLINSTKTLDILVLKVS